MYKLFLYALLLFIVGCGGGSSSDTKTSNNPSTPAQNNAPVVTADDVTTSEKASVTLVANASDSDGSIASYNWRQISGPSVELSDVSASELIFNAPSIIETETLTFNVIVTDDDGATNSTNVNVTVEPIIIASLSISGIASTGELLTGVDVVANYGEVEQSTKTNEVGRYTFNFDIDDDNLDKLLTIKATGTLENGIVNLVSHIDSMSNLIELANDNNNTLSENRVNALKLNHINTAYSILKAQSIEKPISTYAEYELASRQYNSYLLLTYASMIKYAIENYDENQTDAWPVDFTNTFDYFLKKEDVTELYYSISSWNSYALEELEDVIIKDANNFNIKSLDEDTLFYFYQYGALELNADNTGTLYHAKRTTRFDDDFKKEFEWQATTAGITLSFNNPIIEQTNVERTLSNGSNYAVDLVLNGYTLNWLNESQSKEEILFSENREVRLTGTSNVVSLSPEENYMTGYDKDKLVTVYQKISNKAFTNIIASNSSFSLDISMPKNPTYTNSVNNEINIYTFEAVLDFGSIDSKEVSIKFLDYDDINKFGFSSSEGKWSINSDGDLILTFDNLTLSITLIEDEGLTSYSVFTTLVQTVGENEYSSYFKGSFEQFNENNVWNVEDIAGVYQFYNVYSELTPLAVAWYELRVDGTGSLFYSNTRSTYKFGVVYSSDIDEEPLLWQIEDGRLMIRSYRVEINSGGNFCHPSSWQPDDSELCGLYRERQWQPLNISDNGEYTNNSSIFRKISYLRDYNRVNADKENIADGRHIISWLGQIRTAFIKTADRPYQLPNDYVLIKDRTANLVNSVKKRVDISKDRIEKVALAH